MSLSNKHARVLTAVFGLAVAVTFTGCQSRQANNKDVVESAVASQLGVSMAKMSNEEKFAAFESLINRAKVGMTKAEAFESIGINRHRAPNMNVADIKEAITGNREERNGDKDIETTAREMDAYEGHKLPYTDMEKNYNLYKVIKITKEQEGVDMYALLIFKDGKLMLKPRIVGGPVQSTETKPVVDADEIRLSNLRP